MNIKTKQENILKKYNADNNEHSSSRLLYKNSHYNLSKITNTNISVINRMVSNVKSGYADVRLFLSEAEPVWPYYHIVFKNEHNDSSLIEIKLREDDEFCIVYKPVIGNNLLFAETILIDKDINLEYIENNKDNLNLILDYITCQKNIKKRFKYLTIDYLHFTYKEKDDRMFQLYF